jgi:predicted signal transduction protein with EAL and GGDEF domain
MAHVMGMSVVAEGVETPLQLRELERIGVDVLQGFLLGKPAPADEAAHDCLLGPTGQAHQLSGQGPSGRGPSGHPMTSSVASPP